MSKMNIFNSIIISFFSSVKNFITSPKTAKKNGLEVFKNPAIKGDENAKQLDFIIKQHNKYNFLKYVLIISFVVIMFGSDREFNRIMIVLKYIKDIIHNN